MSSRPDFSLVRLNHAGELGMIRMAYVETYPVRPLLNHVDELAALLREYMTEFPAFRAKPEGSPYSDARKEQEADIAREDRARIALAAIDGGSEHGR
jgi:hypothetical protein